MVAEAMGDPVRKEVSIVSNSPDLAFGDPLAQGRVDLGLPSGAKRPKMLDDVRVKANRRRLFRRGERGASTSHGNIFEAMIVIIDLIRSIMPGLREGRQARVPGRQCRPQVAVNGEQLAIARHGAASGSKLRMISPAIAEAASAELANQSAPTAAAMPAPSDDASTVVERKTARPDASAPKGAKVSRWLEIATAAIRAASRRAVTWRKAQPGPSDHSPVLAALAAVCPHGGRPPTYYYWVGFCSRCRHNTDPP
jgi:hypothetical protein